MAAGLQMNQGSYSKIEADETDITLSRLEQISELLGIKPEDVICFNENMVFNVMHNKKGIGISINNMNSTEKKLYDDHIESLKTENAHLRTVVNKLINKRNKPTK